MKAKAERALRSARDVKELDTWIDKVAFGLGRPVAALCEEALRRGVRRVMGRRVALPLVPVELNRKVVAAALEELEKVPVGI
jgi:hypothetical protein